MHPFAACNQANITSHLSCQHQVIQVPVAYTQHIRHNTIAGTTANESHVRSAAFARLSPSQEGVKHGWVDAAGVLRGRRAGGKEYTNIIVVVGEHLGHGQGCDKLDKAALW